MKFGSVCGTVGSNHKDHEKDGRGDIKTKFVWSGRKEQASGMGLNENSQFKPMRGSATHEWNYDFQKLHPMTKGGSGRKQAGRSRCKHLGGPYVL